MSKVMSRANLNALPGQCRKHPDATLPALPFYTMAYAFGQFVLPYVVPVTRRRPRGMSLVGAV